MRFDHGGMIRAAGLGELGTRTIGVILAIPIFVHARNPSVAF
jgi:hypothetical protein